MNEKKKDEVLDREIHLGMLFKFALPTILSTVFMSIYTSVDGMFVARLVNTDALSAVNIVMPLVFVSSGIGMMSEELNGKVEELIGALTKFTV